MQELRFSLNEKDVRRAKSVCDLKNVDYISLMCENEELKLIAYNSETFKVLTLSRPELEDFEVRLNVNSFLSVLAVGTFHFEISGNTIRIARFNNLVDLNNGNYKMIVSLPNQKEIDNHLNKILLMEQRRQIDKPFSVSNLSRITTLQSFSNLSNSGVTLFKGLLYTSGNGFKAFTDVSCDEVNFALTVDGLSQLTKHAHYLEKAFSDMWEIDNYVLLNFDGITLGMNKCRIKSFTELNGFERLKVLASYKIDFDEINHFIKSVKTTKGAGAVAVINTGKRTLAINDRVYGQFCLKLFAEVMDTQDVEPEPQRVIVDVNTLKLTFPNMKSKKSTDIKMTIYDTVVSFMNEDGIRLLIAREG